MDLNLSGKNSKILLAVMGVLMVALVILLIVLLF